MRQALLVSPSPGCGKSKGNGTKRPWTPLKPAWRTNPGTVQKALEDVQKALSNAKPELSEQTQISLAEAQSSYRRLWRPAKRAARIQGSGAYEYEKNTPGAGPFIIALASVEGREMVANS